MNTNAIQVGQQWVRLEATTRYPAGEVITVTKVKQRAIGTQIIFYSGNRDLLEDTFLCRFKPLEYVEATTDNSTNLNKPTKLNLKHLVKNKFVQGVAPTNPTQDFTLHIQLGLDFEQSTKTKIVLALIKEIPGAYELFFENVANQDRVKYVQDKIKNKYTDLSEILNWISWGATGYQNECQTHYGNVKNAYKKAIKLLENNGGDSVW